LLPQVLLTDLLRLPITRRLGRSDENGVGGNFHMFEDVAAHGALDYFIAHDHATDTLGESHQLAPHVLDRGRAAMQSPDATFQPGLLAAGLVDMLIDPRLEYRIMLQPGRHG